MSTRSKWKSPYIKQIIKHKTNNKKNFIMKRNYEITPSIIGKTYNVYNGKLFIKLAVTDEMIGHKIGEFIPTRIKFTFKKKSKK